LLFKITTFIKKLIFLLAMQGFEEQLRRAGLTGNESKVYLELLKLGELSANQIAKKLGMDRTLSYTVLNHLIEKGIVSYVIKDNKKYFQAADPDNLLNPVIEKQVFIKGLIPMLKKIKKTTETPYEINVFEGKEGLRSFIKLVLKQRYFLSFGATGRAYEALYEMPAIVKEIDKKQIQVKIITNIKFKEKPAFAFKEFKYRYLAVKSDVTTSIFGDYVSIHILTQKPFIILIKNKEIAEGYRNYFEFMWSMASNN